MFLPQIMLKLQSKSSKSFIQFINSYVILLSFVCHSYVIGMSNVCTRMLLICHKDVTRMYSYVIFMLLVSARIYGEPLLHANVAC